MKTAVRYQLRTQGRSPLQILPPPKPINRRGGEGRSLIERSDYRIGGGYPETRDFPRDSGDSLNRENTKKSNIVTPPISI